MLSVLGFVVVAVAVHVRVRIAECFRFSDTTGAILGRPRVRYIVLDEHKFHDSYAIQKRNNRPQDRTNKMQSHQCSSNQPSETMQHNEHRSV